MKPTNKLTPGEIISESEIELAGMEGRYHKANINQQHCTKKSSDMA